MEIQTIPENQSKPIVTPIIQDQPINTDKASQLLQQIRDNTESSDQVSPEAQAKAITHILTPQLIARSLQSMTKILARKLDIKEAELTDEDRQDLENSLEPFSDKLDELLKYLPYIPLILFTAGYSIRVITAYLDKKKEVKKKQKEEKEKVPASAYSKGTEPPKTMFEAFNDKAQVKA